MHANYLWTVRLSTATSAGFSVDDGSTGLSECTVNSPDLMKPKKLRQKAAHSIRESGSSGDFVQYACSCNKMLGVIGSR